jgi:hypothetical protein
MLVLLAEEKHAATRFIDTPGIGLPFNTDIRIVVDASPAD